MAAGWWPTSHRTSLAQSGIFLSSGTLGGCEKIKLSPGGGSQLTLGESGGVFSDESLVSLAAGVVELGVLAGDGDGDGSCRCAYAASRTTWGGGGGVNTACSRRGRDIVVDESGSQLNENSSLTAA